MKFNFSLEKGGLLSINSLWVQERGWKEVAVSKLSSYTKCPKYSSRVVTWDANALTNALVFLNRQRKQQSNISGKERIHCQRCSDNYCLPSRDEIQMLGTRGHTGAKPAKN